MRNPFIPFIPFIPCNGSGLPVPAALLARFLSVSTVVTILMKATGREFSPHAIKIMTWGGLRCGISVALAISLKEEIHARQSQYDNVGELILTMTYVVAFSILGGGLTIGPMLSWLGIAGQGILTGTLSKRS